MKYFVIPQKLHGGKIQTVSLSASNYLVATGGDDHLVSIWKAEDLTKLTRVDRTGLNDLCPSVSLAIHNSPVKLIRWCPKIETRFVSASENGLLILSTLELLLHQRIHPRPGLDVNAASPILDGCWSHDGRLFAWSTFDGKVHVFDTVKETHQVLIKGEAETVDKKVTVQQSISFGPTRKSLVCMGDDMLVRIFEYDYDQHDNYHFKMTKKISQFIGNSVCDTTSISYKRISWSCDGEFIAVPNAANQLSSLISLLSASYDWTTKLSLFGHDTLCNSVVFGPHILQSDGPMPTPDAPAYSPDLYHVIATSGSDNSLVLWNTSKELPIAVLKDVSPKPIAEMSWFKSALDLIMVSLDGHLILVGFEENELGRMAPEKVLQDITVSQKILVQGNNGVGNTQESPANKKMKLMDASIDQKNAKSIHTVEKSPKIIDIVTTLPAVSAKEKVTPEVSETQVSDIAPIVPSSEPLKSADDSKLLGGKTAAAKSLTPSDFSRPDSKVASKLVNNLSAPKVTSKDGKKRIQPTLLSNRNNDMSPQSDLAIMKKTHADSSEARVALEFDKPSLLVSDDQLDPKRAKKLTEIGNTKKVKGELEPVRYIGSVVTNPNTSFAKVRLSTPRVRHEFRVTDTSSFLDIKNGQGNENAPSRISNFKNELQVWTDFIPKYIQLAVKGDEFWAVSTSDGQILTYSQASGKRLLPPLVLGSPVSFLESKGEFLMAVTSIAEVYIWDIKKKKSHVKSNLSLAALLDLNMKFKDDTLSKSDSITMCSITSQGIPLVTMSNGSGYMFNRDMEVWQTVTETWWAFGSHYWDSIGDDKISESQASNSTKDARQSSLISLLEHKTNEELLRKSRSGRGKYFSKISKNMIMKEGFENLENTISISHLENRILCSELLGEQSDFRDFLAVYTNRLCELGLKAKLYEVFMLIMGEEESVSKTKICGLDRTDLLKEMIIACSEHRDSQRILVYFGQKIGLIDMEYS